jgi:hypothetical protein
MAILENLNSNFEFQIHSVTSQDFPLITVTGNLYPPEEFFPSGNQGVFTYLLPPDTEDLPSFRRMSKS